MRGGGVIERLQPLGRALMLPIAVLPIAALLLRLGQPDLLAVPFVAAAGQAIFDHLGLLFAAGVAVGLARENHGAAALAGIVCYLVATEGAKPLMAVPDAALVASTDAAIRDLLAAAWRAREIGKLSVPAGILSGLIAGALYNRFHAIALPAYLGFFAGRRFVPIAAGIAGIGLALAFGAGFPLFETAVDALSRWVVGAGSLGLFLYGLFNRLLLVTGLHHILNNFAWFLLGDYGGTTGDLKRFFAGDPSAGAFMSGFFPVMMFGLPAACLAMYRSAAPERRASVAGLYLSLGLTSFLTGVTEPIEFTFLFLAPVLFVVHAVLTGIAMVVMDLIGSRLGFGFSAGLFDYVLNFGLATRPLAALPVGLAYAVIYYGAFRWTIARFDLKLPGREAAAKPPVVTLAPNDRAAAFVAALGGSANLVEIGACTTRLRLVLGDPTAVDRDRLAALGARGVLDLGRGRVQVVVGPEADTLSSAIRAGGPPRGVPLSSEGDEVARDEMAASPGVAELAALVDSWRRDDPRADFVARGKRLLCTTVTQPPAGLAQSPAVRVIVPTPSGFHVLCMIDAQQVIDTRSPH